ncbi:MAG TPA: amidohydrolase family protein [Bryobacteraceae bacterium]|nr:amidohydrolase family protein [Bryobacteraceae bacterium]
MIDLNAYLGHFAFRQLRYNTADGLLRLMDRKRIERAAVSSAAAITYRNPQAGNEEVAAEVKAHRDRLIPFAVLNPAYAGWRDDLKICQEEFGVRGLRLYPRWHNYRLTDCPCLDLVHAAAERGLPVSIPIRVEDRRQQSWLVDIPDVNLEEIATLIKAAPRASFVLVSGSGFVNSSLGRPNSGLPANYAVEISLLTAELENEIGQLVNTLGEDRVVFGTGMPFHYPDPALTKLEILDVSESVKEKIRSANAARLLKL